MLDFAFDPFDKSRMVVGELSILKSYGSSSWYNHVSACEDAKLRLWTIPIDGLSATLTEPEYLIG